MVKIFNCHILIRNEGKLFYLLIAVNLCACKVPGYVRLAPDELGLTSLMIFSNNAARTYSTENFYINSIIGNYNRCVVNKNVIAKS